MAVTFAVTAYVPPGGSGIATCAFGFTHTHRFLSVVEATRPEIGMPTVVPVGVALPNGVDCVQPTTSWIDTASIPCHTFAGSVTVRDWMASLKVPVLSVKASTALATPPGASTRTSGGFAASPTVVVSAVACTVNDAAPAPSAPLTV